MKQKLPYIHKKLAVASGVAAAIAVVFHSWFLSFGVRTSGDWGVTLKQTADTLRRHYFGIWLSDSSFGRVLIDAGQAPSYAVYGWLSYYFGTSYALNERLIHLWPAVVGAVLSSLFLSRYVFRDWAAAGLGAIVYSTNTYFLALLTGHLTLAVAYALTPLVVLFYLRAVTNRKLLDILLSGLTLAVCGAYEPRSAYIIVLMLMVLATCHALLVYIPKHGITLRGLSKLAVVYATPLVLFGLLNLYWVLGLAFAGGAGSAAAIESSLFGNEFFDMSSALTLFHPFWSGGAIEPFIIHIVPLYFWLIPLAAFIGLALCRKNRLMLFFGIVGLVGVFLSKQSDAPFPMLYDWLFNHLPGFNAFREASKFYLLTAVAYMVLIPALFMYIKNWHKRMLTIAAFAILSLLFLPNLLPVATNGIGATFSNRTMPDGYAKLNKLLDKADYSRILWVPQKSRWSLVSANHPSVNASKLTTEAWKDLQGGFKETSNATPTDEINDLIAQRYTPVLLSSAGIKYIVVPMRDLQNSDNFFRSFNDDPAIFADALSSADYLKESSIQVDGFKVYETRAAARPYFSSTADLYTVQSGKDLASAYKLWQNNLQSKDFTFLLQEKGKTQTKPYTTDITDLLGTSSTQDIAAGALPIASPIAKKQASYYFDPSFVEADYQAGPGTFTYRQEKQPLPGTTEKQASSQTVSLNPVRNYLLKIDDAISDVTRDAKRQVLGSPRKEVKLYAQNSGNLLPAPKYGIMWQKKVTDCAPYGKDKAHIAMRTVQDDKTKQKVRSLQAKNHAACTTPGEVSVESGGQYIWSFKYRGSKAQLLSYRLEYSNGQTVTKNIAVDDNQWHNLKAILNVPHGADKLKIYLIARPSNQARATAEVSFTAVQLARVNQVATLFTAQPAIKNSFKPKQKDTYAIDKSKNIVPNGSFEHGLWKQKVGDCNAHDDHPALRMKLSDKAPSQGSKALQLEAKRHIACTDTQEISVQGGATYRLQFDYQSPNAQQAGYAVTTNDPNATQISERFNISGNKWQTLTKTITVPQHATALRIAVFAYSDESRRSYSVNRYDNFILQRVPDLSDRFFRVSSPAEPHAQPKDITFEHTSNTQKSITVKGASKPFFLLMSEQYHPAWKLNYGTIPDKSLFNYLPWRAKPRVADADHLKANAFQNAWYINPQTICRDQPTACTKSHGSYTIKFTAIFNAQRWFNFGLVVSIATAIVSVGIVAGLLGKRFYIWIRKSRR